MKVHRPAKTIAPERLSQPEERPMASARPVLPDVGNFAAHVLRPSDMLPFKPRSDGRFWMASTVWYLGFVRRAWSL